MAGRRSCRRNPPDATSPMPHSDGPSLATVAQAAGVSKATVWRVLRGDGRERVASAVALQIRQTAQRLGWRVRQSVRDDRTAKRPLLAVVGLSRMPIGPSVHSDLLGLLVTAAEMRHVDLLPIALNDGLSQWRQDGRAEQIDGAILLDYLWREVDLASRLGVPVCLWHMLPDPHLDQVEPDERQGMRDALLHLRQHGHRHLAWYAETAIQPHHSTIHRQQTLAEADWARVSQVDSADALARLLNTTDRPTAVICNEEHRVPLVMSVISGLGLQIPTDLSLVAAGNDTLLSWLQPAVSAIVVPVEEMADHAIDLLLSRIASDTDLPPRRRILAESFRPRNTSGPAP